MREGGREGGRGGEEGDGEGEGVDANILEGDIVEGKGEGQ